MSATDTGGETLLDAGLFIGALLSGDPRHAEARSLVEAARQGRFRACTTTGILSEVYAALTWHLARPAHAPDVAAQAVRSLVEAPAAIRVLDETQAVALKMLQLAAEHSLTARRIHDARHAACATVAGVSSVYTYDAQDWQVFQDDGLRVMGPPSVLRGPTDDATGR